jgi:hypothetical protein
MKYLLQNFWLKMLALVIGLLVWFHVATDKTYTYQLRLPVTQVDLREHNTLASLPPDSLTVVVSAKGKQLIRSEWREQGVRINISKLQSGEHVFNLTPENTSLINVSKNVRIDEIVFPNPIEVDVDVESKVELPVQPEVTISPDDGYAITGRVEVLPPRVMVTGPKSILRSLKSVHIENRELSGIRNNITIAARVEPPQGYGIKIEPESVIVKMNIVPVSSKVFESIPVIVYNTPSNRSITPNPQSVRIELTGPPDEINLLNRNSITASVDFRQRDSLTGMAPIKVDCPANIRVKKISNDAIRIVSASNADSGN